MKNNIGRIIFLSVITIALASCSSSRVSMMTTDEVLRVADSLGSVYYVDVSLNRDYVNRHPIPVTDRLLIRNYILRASPVLFEETPATVVDSVGRIAPKRLSDADYERIGELRDSLRWASVYSRYGSGQHIELQDHYEFVYSLSISELLQPDKTEFTVSKNYVRDKKTGEITDVEIVDKRFSILSNPPFIAFISIDFKFGNQVYTAYEVFDGRAQSSRRKTGIIRVK